MNIPKEAIEKAVAGGWRTKDEDLLDVINLDWEDFFWQKAALDPTFWQALGKELGWPLTHEVSPEHHLDNGETCWCRPKIRAEHGSMMVVHEDRTPQGYLHTLVDMLFANGDTEQFWKELLSNQ